MAYQKNIVRCTDQTSKVAGCIDTKSLSVEWEEIPYDTKVMGYPVIHIKRMIVHGSSAVRDFVPFESDRDKIGCGLVSCRLPHDCLRESMFLEDQGFRFVEMLYQPELVNLQSYSGFNCSHLTVTLASADDIPAIVDIACQAFTNERFHIDPRLSSHLGSQRYCNWVRSSFIHNSQQLYVVREKSLLVAFFVIEKLDDGTCYWHLNAVSPVLQGQGYGRRAWLAMLELALTEGMSKIRTCIVARNYRVLNLYASLGFRFSSPMMTFHWVRLP